MSESPLRTSVYGEEINGNSSKNDSSVGSINLSITDDEDQFAHLKQGEEE